MNSYTLIIASSIIVILSYFFNIISRKTNIPSVLLLISTGILIHVFLKLSGIQAFDLMPVLEILGIVGLIMIVLEASLDLKLGRDKKKVLTHSFFVALFSLVFTALLITLVLVVYLDTYFIKALLYALPLSIVSSAIIIPSISGLRESQREFMIYESTFSDILGIMFFYLVIESAHAGNAGEISLHILVNVVGTVAISFIVSYILILIFQNIKTQVKLFLLIATLILLYSIAKMLHFSSLLLILIFGLVLQNRNVFFPGRFRNLLNELSLREISQNFKIITQETAFVVRTFFFVIFGMTITLSTLFNIKVLFVSLLILIIIYGIRFFVLKVSQKGDTFPLTFLAPRGLITILLFYAIPEDMKDPGFHTGILLFIIISGSIIMATSLVNDHKRKAMEIEFPGKSI